MSSPRNLGELSKEMRVNRDVPMALLMQDAITLAKQDFELSDNTPLTGDVIEQVASELRSALSSGGSGAMFTIMNALSGGVAGSSDSLGAATTYLKSLPRVEEEKA